MKVAITYFIAFFLIVSVFSVLRSDWYRRNFQPASFWEEEYKQQNDSLLFSSQQLQSCMLQLKKVKLTRKIDIQQSILSGLSPEEAYKQYQLELEYTVETCELFHAAVEQLNQELDFTKRQIQNLQ